MSLNSQARIILKHSYTTGRAPTVDSLEAGEIAINMADAKLFYKETSGTIRAINLDRFDMIDEVVKNIYGESAVIGIELTSIDGQGGLREPLELLKVKYSNGNVESLGNIKGERGEPFILHTLVDYAQNLPTVADGSIDPLDASNGALALVKIGEVENDGNPFAAPHIYYYHTADAAASPPELEHWEDLGEWTQGPKGDQGEQGLQGLQGPANDGYEPLSVSLPADLTTFRLDPTAHQNKIIFFTENADPAIMEGPTDAPRIVYIEIPSTTELTDAGDPQFPVGWTCQFVSRNNIHIKFTGNTVDGLSPQVFSTNNTGKYLSFPFETGVLRKLNDVNGDHYDAPEREAYEAWTLSKV